MKTNVRYKYDIISPNYGYINQEDIQLIKSSHGISLGDLIGEDHDIWIQKNKTFGFDIEIDNENTETILREEGLHPYAIESLALFCKRFLNSYARFSEME